MEQADFSRIQAIQQHIEDTQYSDFGQNLSAIYDEMVNLNAWKSFTGKMMAEYKKDLNAKKVEAYNSLIFSQRAAGVNISPSLAKEYINCKCGEMQYLYDFTERVNNSCAYAIDSLRSILSALKQELQTLQYTAQ